jgi:HlyD family secretion protein
MSRVIKKIGITVILLGLLGGAYYYYQKAKIKTPEQLYRLQDISRGDVARSVSANGTLNPVTLISVGTQVSGRVSKLYVDFNDHVEKDQVLLELDDALFTAQIAQSTGNVRNAEASVELAKANEQRTRSLLAQEYVSKQELDQAVQALKSARAQLDTARGQLRRDQTNLGYSIIRSPVSGVVVDRVVDIGQTVAASFQTPTLIKIAQDLSKMQIGSSFAEADIANIQSGQAVKFSVDAYPNRNFDGVVKELRLNPTVTSNVVTYNVVVAVDNPEKILLPGMTAYVSIVVAKRENVLLAPNAALRFKPKLDESQSTGSAQNKPSGRSKKKPVAEDLGSGTIYIIKNGKLAPVRVGVGISDSRFTEITSDALKENDQVVVGEKQANESSSSGSTMRFRMF